MPITVLKRDTFGTEKAELQARIQSHAAVLTRLSMGLPVDAPVLGHGVRYCFREIIRNVFEHSQADECVVLGQWYQREDLEIAILDRGLGIKKTLEKKFKIENDSAGLQLAIQPGISGVNLEEEGVVNSGFGLYVLSELGRRIGCFSMVSGKAAINIHPGGKMVHGADFPGTAIRLILRKPKGVNPEALLKKLLKREKSCQNPKEAKVLPSGQKFCD